MFYSQFDTNLTPIEWTIGSRKGIYLLVKVRSEVAI